MILRQLFVELGFKTDEAGLKSFQNKMGAASRGLQTMGTNMTLAITAPLAGLGVWAVRASEKQQQAMAQVRQGLISTGNTAGKTMEDLTSMARKMQRETLFGDEDILQGATAQLLTFTNITGKNFDKTQQAALDVSSRLYGANANAESLRNTSIMLGKALNDPVANLGALSRAGIQFSVAQKEMIKRLVSAGKLETAQAIILEELNKQYGGSAKAAADASNGVKQLLNAASDLAEEFGKILTPVVKKLVDTLRVLIGMVSAMPGWVKKTMIAVAAILAVIGPLLFIVGKLISLIAFFGPGGVFVTSILPVMKAFFAISIKWFAISLKWAGKFLLRMLPLITTLLAGLAIFLMLQDVMAWIQGKDSIFGSWVGDFDTFAENVIFQLDRIGKWFKEIFDSIVNSITGFIDSIGGIFTEKGLGRFIPSWLKGGTNENVERFGMGVGGGSQVNNSRSVGTINQYITSPDPATAGAASRMQFEDALAPAPNPME